MLNRLFGKSRKPSGNDPQNEDQHDSPVEQTQPGEQIPVQVSDVTGLEIVFETPTQDGAEKDFLTFQGVSLMKACWPGFVEAVTGFNSDVRFRISFAADSDKAMSALLERAQANHWNLMTQPQATVLAHPSKGDCRYQFRLNVFLATRPGAAGTVVVIAQNHRLAPAISQAANSIQMLLNAPSRDQALQAGEALWAAGDQGLLQALRWCIPYAETAPDAVREFLNNLLACPSAKIDQFVRLFMLVWCAEDEQLSAYGVALYNVQSTYGGFNHPEAKSAAAHIGQKASEIGGLKAMQRLYKGVEKLAGTDAAYGLTFAWDGVGGWMT